MMRANLAAIQTTLEDAGAEFLDSDNGGPGVRACAPIDASRPVRRPSSARYKALIDALEKTDETLESGDTPPLEVTIIALQAVIQFLRSDPSTKVALTGTALRRLLGDLCDITNGAKPKMLFEGNLMRQGKSGRPTGLTVDVLRGHLVAALNVLIDAKMKNRDAAKYIADKLSAANVRLSGKVVSVSQILQWREQTGDTAPKAADEAAKRGHDLTAPYLAAGGLEAAKQVADLHVKVVAGWQR